jgi:cytochrome c-type biogenesis protein CcmH/NrfF
LNGYLIFAVAAVILCSANAVGSYAVGRSDFYDSRQKTVQIALVWLLPIFGLLLVGGVLWSNYERPSSTGEHPEHDNPDFAWPNVGLDDYQHGDNSI